MKAVVARALNQIEVTDVELDPPKAGEVLVKMKATGVCRSDLSVAHGVIGGRFPIVLGHEGAGVIERVGEGVTRLRPGQHVVLAFSPRCGRCHYCVREKPAFCEAFRGDGMQLDGTSRVRLDGEDCAVMTMLGNMAEYAVVPELSVVPIDDDIPFGVAALIGCGVTTGVGAVLRTANVPPGSTVAVVGCGGVGMAVVQGARIAGATKIIAVDVSDEKLAQAREFGATDTLRAGPALGKRLKEMTGGRGVEYAFEVIARPETLEECIKGLDKGGKLIHVGVGPIGETYSLSLGIMPLLGKSVLGSFYGDVNSPVDFPMYLDFYQRGLLDLDRMVSRTYSLDEAPLAFQHLEEGKNVRGVILHD